MHTCKYTCCYAQWLSMVEPFVPNRSIVCVSNWTLSGAFWFAAGRCPCCPWMFACVRVCARCWLCLRLRDRKLRTHSIHAEKYCRNDAISWVPGFVPVHALAPLAMTATSACKHECSQCEPFGSRAPLQMHTKTYTHDDCRHMGIHQNVVTHIEFVFIRSNDELAAFKLFSPCHCVKISRISYCYGNKTRNRSLDSV